MSTTGLNQSYPDTPTRFPIVWASAAHEMIPPRFAVWYRNHRDYQIFDIERCANNSVILKPTRSERVQPFYFAESAEGGDNESRTITIYNPRATKNPYSDSAIWFTGAWLCKRLETNRLRGVIPIMCVSHPNLFPYKGSVGIHRSIGFHAWQMYLSDEYMSEMIRNRKVFTSLHPIHQEEVPEIQKIPEFVAQALLDAAVKKEEMCPISMEHFTAGKTAVTSCFHLFEKDCLVEWMKQKSCCPVCKKTDVQFVIV